MKRIYLHKGQQLYRMCSANSSVNICSRRWGKSYIMAMRIMENVLEMPRSTGVFMASSFRQAHSRTLPSALQAMDVFGWKRDIHYVVGRKPDKRLGFETPLFLPSDLKDTIWFANGSIMIIVSQEVVMSANSMTVHWLVGDEAKGLDYEKLVNEVFPAIGGSSVYYNDPSRFPHLWGTHFFTDMPCSKEGVWLIRKFEDAYDKELCDTIIGMELRRVKLLQMPSTTYTKRELGYLSARLSLLRSRAFYFQERSIFDNIAVVGLDYVRRCRRNLTPMVFKASILCKRITEAEGKFYQNFSEKIHTYTATDNSKLNDYREQRYDCMLDTDLNRDGPIAVAFDYNAQITTLCAGQIQGGLLKTIKVFYTKYDRRLRDCIRLFCEYYKGHPEKTVEYYFDHTAKGQNYIEYNHDAHFCVRDEFEKNGWVVHDHYIGMAMEHNKKHLVINNAFQGSETLFPMFNKDNAAELIQAMLLAGLRMSEKGFRKDKSGEKSLETDTSLPLELRTDITDSWDTLFLGCLMDPYDKFSFALA